MDGAYFMGEFVEFAPNQCGDCGSSQQLLPIIGTFGTTGVICDSCYRELILESAEAMPMDSDQ